MAKKKVTPKEKNQIGRSGEMVGSPIKKTLVMMGEPMDYSKMPKKAKGKAKKC